MIRAFIVAIVVSLFFAASTTAQGPSTGIQATGTGTANAPAQTAHLQILVGSSAAFGMGPMEMAPGTPSSDMPMSGPMMGPAGLTEEQLDSVIDAIVGAGIGEDAIEVTMPVYNSFFGPGGPETAEIRVTIDQPQREDLVDLVAAIRAAAQDGGLSVLYVGARYEAADCAALTQEARDAAIADAISRAEGLAQGLGLALGELTQAAEFPYYGPTGTDSCVPTGTGGDFGPYGPGTEPAFDATATEATVTVQVTLTYEIGAAA
jgi:uncharacterized protein YggE